MTNENAPAASQRANTGRKILRLFSGIEIPRIKIPNEIPGFRFVNASDLVILALFSAICATAIIVVVSIGIAEVQNAEDTLILAVFFIILLILYRISQNAIMRRTSDAIEKALSDQRRRLAEKIIQLNLEDVQQLQDKQLGLALSRYFEPISQSLMPILIGFQSAILLVFITCFIFYQSFLVGIITIVFVAFTIRYYFNREKELTRLMTTSAEAEAKLRLVTQEMMTGFKELKLSASKRRDIIQHIASIASDVSTARTSTASVFGDLIILGASTTYMLSATVVFLLPVMESIDKFALSQIVTTEFFLLGPLGAFVRAGEPLSILRFSFRKIEELEGVLDRHIQNSDMPSDAPLQSFTQPFESLKLDNISYYHASDEGPLIGISDVNFTASAGEVIFITGGNGSGKTTLLRVLTGLYPAQTGSLFFNDEVLSESEMPVYQETFSTVFADFHNFSSLYGLDTEARGRLAHYLTMVGLADLVRLDKTYAPNALSTGQKKRLALALALSEKKPVLILDEWAADQDPEFRKYFYEVILPLIKREGTTVIAVTHDERYFHVADRRYHMEEGKLKEKLSHDG